MILVIMRIHHAGLDLQIPVAFLERHQAQIGLAHTAKPILKPSDLIMDLRRPVYGKLEIHHHIRTTPCDLFHLFEHAFC